MRGKLDYVALTVHEIGITPADAGKTLISAGRTGCSWDHPRGCGENRLLVDSFGDIDGSPPRMRGKPMHFRIWYNMTGITPADAGKT